MKAISQYLNRLNRPSEIALQAFNEIQKTEVFSKGSYIQATNTTCRNLYFVEQGIARIFYLKKDEDVTEHFAFSGQMIIRAESLFNDCVTPKGIQALTETTVIKIGWESLQMLFPHHRELETLFREIVQIEYANTVKRVESLQFKDARERYEELLQETQFVNQIPLKYIATYLGISQVSLSRIRKKISD
ncbi:MAG: Crp/Fnr family transcriptional regulator [Bacteroidota bacterium]